MKSTTSTTFKKSSRMNGSHLHNSIAISQARQKSGSANASRLPPSSRSLARGLAIQFSGYFCDRRFPGGSLRLRRSRKFSKSCGIYLTRRPTLTKGRLYRFVLRHTASVPVVTPRNSDASVSVTGFDFSFTCSPFEVRANTIRLARNREIMSRTFQRIAERGWLFGVFRDAIWR
jgi:hypothetical protein